MNIRLELDNIRVLRKKERWNIYFVVVAQDPNDPNKKLVTHFPDHGRLIRLRPASKNYYSFVPEGDGDVDGLRILEVPMPANQNYAAELYVRHHHSIAKDYTKIMDKIFEKTGTSSSDLVSDVLGKNAKWLPIGKDALHIVENVLANYPDRKMGMISMDEDFGKELKNNTTELDRTNKTTTSDVELTWTWILEDPPSA